MANRSSSSRESVPYDYVFDEPAFPLSVMPIFSAEDIDLHTHERFYEIVLVVAGSAVHNYDSCSYAIHPGNIFVVPPGGAHGYCRCQNLDYYNVHIDFKSLKISFHDLVETAGYKKLFMYQTSRDKHLQRKLVPGQLDIQTLDHAAVILKKMYEIQIGRRPGYFFSLLTKFMEFMELVCGYLNTCSDDASAATQRDVNIPVWVEQIAALLSRYCAEPWTIGRMCHRFNLSQGVLYRIFHTYYHTSPQVFLTRQRIRKSLSLLTNSGMPLEEVATQCGYANGSYFSTVFRKELGMSPLQYRKKPDNRTFLKSGEAE